MDVPLVRENNTTNQRGTTSKGIILNHDDNEEKEEDDDDDEEETNAEVRALAAALAPSILETEEILQVPIEFRTNTSSTEDSSSTRKNRYREGNNDNDDYNDDDNDDDDNLDDEVDALQSSEALLRQELEMAQDFSSLFQFTQILPFELHDDNFEDENYHHNSMTITAPTTTNENDHINVTSTESSIKPDAKGRVDDLNDIEAEDEEAGGVNECLTPIKLTNQPTSGSPVKNIGSDQKKKHDDNYDDINEPFVLLVQTTTSPSLSIRRPKYNPIPYTVRDHQRTLSLRKEQYGGWYSVGIGRYLGISTRSKTTTTATTTTTTTTATNYNSNENETAETEASIVMNANDVDENDFLVNEAVREYCLSMPTTTLQKLFVGLPDRNTTAASSLSTTTTTTNIVDDDDDMDGMTKSISNRPTSTTTGDDMASSLPISSSSSSPVHPVRTITMPIRPDVLCGAVMEVVHQAFLELHHVHITKRQGGHIQGVVFRPKKLPLSSAIIDINNNNAPFMIDVRLVTCKSENCDRVLLLRIYHQCFQNNIVDEIVPNDDNEASRSTENDQIENESDQNVDDILCESNDVSRNMALHLREAAALIQIIESTKGIKKRIIQPTTSSIVDLTPDDMTTIVSKHLLEHYRACPSVKDAGITLPSLNAEDFAIIQSSGRLIQLIWDEIETRDLAYITLRSSRFGSFPSLPTLDVHYCSQLRRISRELMTTQLIKSALELEQYAREAELACANMITLLRPTFEAYGVEAPQLPKPKRITEYPFDFVPSQTSCPPWGVRVQHALNEIQAWTGDANRTDAPDSQIFPTTQSMQYAETSISMANSAVRLILEAFQKQDDDEQSARLGRKNIQVIDRLAKMQAHELLSIQTIQNCYNISDKALFAAQKLCTNCGIREVPLLKWTIMVGRSTGTCTITADHILFVTKLIPVLGGNKTVVFNVDDVELIMEEVTASILNPLPTIINVKQNRRTMFTFRPSMGAVRLTNFFHVVKGAASRTLFDVSD